MPIKLERGNIPKPETTDEFEVFEGFVNGVDQILERYKNEPAEIKEALIIKHRFENSRTEEPDHEQDDIQK